jgi:hypothetical protein
MEVSDNVSLPSEIVGYVGRIVGQWWARFNDCGTPDIGSGGLIPDMRDDLIDVVQYEPMCGGLDDDAIREFAGLLDSSSFDRTNVLERARQDFRYVSDETELIAFGLCVCVFDAMFPQHVVMRSVSGDEMLRKVAFPDDRWFRLAMSRTEADRMDAYRSGLGHVQLAYSRMFDGLAGMFRQ